MDDSISPRTILCSNQKFLDQLFDLFDKQQSNKEISEKVWEILLLLPTNPKILKQLHALEVNFSWNQLLNPESSFQLLYNLQIVESIVGDSPDAVSTTCKRNSSFFCCNFHYFR
jgi:hypothetical protein